MKNPHQERAAIRLTTWMALFVVLLVMPTPAAAFELSGGVGLGGFMSGTAPRLAVSPNAGIAWRIRSDFLLALHNLCSVLPSTDNGGIGVYNQTRIAVGYAFDKANFSVGPSLSIYTIPACGSSLCGRVVGVAPGGHVRADVYFAGPLGVSASVNVDWIGGRSLVLQNGVAVMVVGGPLLRWSAK